MGGMSAGSASISGTIHLDSSSYLKADFVNLGAQQNFRFVAKLSQQTRQTGNYPFS